MLTLILERTGKSTAKPRKIQLEQGTVLLSGFPKDIANAIEAHIANFKHVESGNLGTTVNLLMLEEAKELAPSKELQVFQDKALGLRELKDVSPRQWEVVVVGYNSVTKEAQVEEVKSAGDFKAHAESVFMQELVKRRVI